MQYRNFRNALWIVLFPLSVLWAAVASLRRRLYPRSWRYRSPIPVIGVGNLHSGGTGKTPIVMAICERYAEKAPAIVSRGYRGHLSREGAFVDLSAAEGPRDFGDEPWMLAKRSGCPVRIGKDRVAAVREAEKLRPGLIVLDDGFQHLPLGRSVDIVVIATDRPLMDSYCLPLGDLREPLSALSQATAVVLNPGSDESSFQDWQLFLSRSFPSVPVFESHKIVEGVWEGEEPVAIPDGTPLAAFSGVASPAGFERSLAALGPVAFAERFPDHHTYTPADVDALIERKRVAKAELVTTDKDWPKAHPLFLERGERLLSLRIRYEFPREFWYFLGSVTGLESR